MTGSERNHQSLGEETGSEAGTHTHTLNPGHDRSVIQSLPQNRLFPPPLLKQQRPPFQAPSLLCQSHQPTACHRLWSFSPFFFFFLFLC